MIIVPTFLTYTCRVAFKRSPAPPSTHVGAHGHLVGTGVARLADGEGHVAVLDHVLDLAAHRQAEQNQPVDDEDGPEDGQVENLKPGAEEADGNGLCRRVPELELGQAAHKGAELLVFFCGQARCIAVLHALILLEGRVELGGEEGEEQVQQVDAERVGNNVPALGDEDAHAEGDEEESSARPAVRGKRGRLVEVCLEELRVGVLAEEALGHRGAGAAMGEGQHVRGHTLSSGP
jgi:hypothetical protein